MPVIFNPNNPYMENSPGTPYNPFPNDPQSNPTSGAYVVPVQPSVPSIPSPVIPAPPAVPQPIPQSPSVCRLSSVGLALNETPIQLNGTVRDFFSSIHNPTLNIIQTDGEFRAEAEDRLNQFNYPTSYMFMNTGVQYTTDICYLLSLQRGNLNIPYTNSINFISIYYSPIDALPPDYYYLGTDGFLYRLEIRSNEMPEAPPGTSLGSGKVYYQIDASDILQNQDKDNTYGMWTSPTDGSDYASLYRFFTSSIAQQGTASRLYHMEVRNAVHTSCQSKVQFNIAYGHSGGSGSRDMGGYDYLTPSKAVYGQYRQLCLEASQSKFIINNIPADSIFAVTAKRDRMKDRMDEGNWELNLHHLSGSQFESEATPRWTYTGSAITVGRPGRITRLIDDSTLYSPVIGSPGEIYNVVSGSLEQGIYNPTSPIKFGLFYPKLGTIILDTTILDTRCNFLTVTSSDVPATNPLQLFKSISGSSRYTDRSGDQLGFQARKVRKLYNTIYYIRVKNPDFNFSNNPTYWSGSDGLIVNDFQGQPKTYITTVGLYNSRKELLAVGKISKPICKTYTEESLLKVNLKYE